MNIYQEISQIIKEADGILVGASNGLSIAEGYNIFADDAWFQENMGDFTRAVQSIALPINEYARSTDAAAPAETPAPVSA